MSLYCILVEDKLPKGWMPEPMPVIKRIIELADPWLRVISVEEVK